MAYEGGGVGYCFKENGDGDEGEDGHGAWGALARLVSWNDTCGCGDAPERKEPVTMAAACTPPMEGVDSCVILYRENNWRLEVDSRMVAWS